LFRIPIISRLLRYSGEVEFLEADATTDNFNLEVYKWMMDWLNMDLTEKRILDAGCWNAPFEHYLKKNNIDASWVGLDLNQTALKSITIRSPKAPVVIGDLTKELPFAHDSFDVIVYLQAYEHLPKGKDRDSLKHLAKLLKPNGTLILSTQLNSPLTVLDPAWVLGHRHYWPGDLRKSAELAGLHVVNEAASGGFWQYMDVMGLYFAKHVFRRKYSTPNWMKNLCVKEFTPHSKLTSTMYWLRCQKKATVDAK